MIDTYKEEYRDGILKLWNTAAVKLGYKELDMDSFSDIFTGNAYFNPEQAFVMRKANEITGFACGCMGEDLPLGETSGYITCVILGEDVENSENYIQLLSLLEETFQRAGKTQSEILFFNPMMLPWYIRNTDRHEHNNAPGVFKNSRFYEELLQNGYVLRTTEQAMYLDLKGFGIPQAIAEKEEKAAGEGYEVSLFDKARHCNVEQMLKKLENPLWEREILQCTREGTPVLIAAKNGAVVGFAGPMLRQENGRGYFTGIGVVKEHEGHGLGTILFYKLCEEEKKVQAAYMSLYTGAENPAARIYSQAGFRRVQEFAVMRKML
ncbi:Acetyltransferase (GNAT) family protein [Anaerocolumna jejuensis DSM 15929]|uniref:Acetyltransferase (GNAT) family protein n=1 Tax=Anaerocolumna jejuensis DSM 15929 TaxID=1121322 RepID=A0A1M7AP24_9FIRM|nr:GNAT family N-acetyltransferase [Anaerocolumna jejuensis]SHL44336.1 Acetyltransferase (GNAT) family protein [Anaerocolumna jejuensis DSM 15929]